MSTISDLPLKILVVDDERSIRRFLNASLGNRYTILEAENGTEAIQAVALNQPDLIILDLGLPDMDGTEVTRRLREWTDVPVIVISVRDSEQDKVAALDVTNKLRVMSELHSTQAQTTISPNLSAQANCWHAFGSPCAIPINRKTNP